MKVIHWNISYSSDKEKVLETLSRLVKDEDVIVCLQEVQPSVKDFLVDKLQGWGGTKGTPYAYSLDYRQPGKYDGKNRKLGVLILCPASMYIIDSGVFNRTPFPDRTLWAEVLYQGEVIKVASLHSITGCGYSKAKSTQYFSFSEAIGEFAPDILTIDANEPEVDHWDITQAKFYDNKDKGEGARTFFTNLSVNHMVDIYALCFNHDDFELRKPLTPSVKVNRKGYCRYDFIFVSDPKFDFCNCEYLYQAGLDGTSDHAVVVATLFPTSMRTGTRRNEDVLNDNCMFPYNLLQEKHLIKYCRYYGHNYPGKSGLMAEYEHHWIKDVINNECDLSHYVSDYDLNWLQTFNIEDGVPLGLKAILFNRYFHWSSYATVDDFKRWYLETYLTGKYGE